MKNHRITLSIIFFTFLLSGCSLVKGLTAIPLRVAMIPVNVADRALGTNMTKSIDREFDEVFKQGKKMEAQAIKRELSGNTSNGINYISFLKEDGTAILKNRKEDRVIESKWVATTGQVCIDKDCYEIRVKDNHLLVNSGTYFKKGDTENLNAQLENQIQADTAKRRAEAEESARKQRAEAEESERKRITDPIYEKAAKLANDLKCEEALEIDREAQSQDGKEHSENEKSDGSRIGFSNCKNERIFKYTLNSKNPQEMYLAAGKYEREGYGSRANEIYEAIISHFPNSTWSVKASDQLNASKRASAAQDAANERQRTHEREAEESKSACRSRIASCTSSCGGYFTEGRSSCVDRCQSICTAF